ncbi:MAG: helix-turn-helix domain-containing protein [Candidatus Susulua stagnicola]|nr:helix-turn-helix domain-containing protein [Candidatus Susulua stagnicola]
MKDYMSVKEASEILNCTRQEIVRKIWRGFIKAERVGKAYIIHKKEIDKLKKKKK